MFSTDKPPKMFSTIIASFLLVNTVWCCHLFPSANNYGRLELEIVGNPQYFVSSSPYTVTLKSNKQFREFFLITEGDERGGTFQVTTDGKSTFSDSCINTITQSVRTLKKEINVLWTAPKKGCANIRAAVKIQSHWEAVNKTICSVEENTPSIKKCCACDHAKYRLTFEGLWSPQTHPKDFPNVLWMTHFSDIIGATHGEDFSMWEEGKLSSYGMQQMAEYGIVRELDNELRNQSKKLRTIVHAAGLWYPDVNSKTTSVFRVDPRKHLLSIATMFGPTPDWFVGLSKYDLCLPNCTWLENVVMDLYPYDAGTDSGISYMSENVPTDPPERIQKITTMFPEDARSPFYDPVNNRMESFAKLTITRENLYPKKCTDLTEEEILQELDETENTEDQKRPECEVTKYTNWSPCSVSCGKGIRQRSRKYVNSDKAHMSKCDRQLVSKEMCAAPVSKCPGESEEEEEITPDIDSTCDVTPWTDWSDCTATCGIGMKFRSRTLVANENTTLKKCQHIGLMEKQKCMEPPCHSQQIKIPRACSVSEWSEWSPCSVSCGEGYRKRLRNFKSDKVPKYCYTSVNLTESIKCKNPTTCDVSTDDAQSICRLKIAVGTCRGAFKRWAYEAATGRCVEFWYGGCRGNKNNFETLVKCSDTCTGVKEEYNSNENQERVNCVVGPWSSWSPCYPCTGGTKTKSRQIIKAPKNGGRPCPALQKTVSCRVPVEFCF